jgi:hypothetical protein
MIEYNDNTYSQNYHTVLGRSLSIEGLERSFVNSSLMVDSILDASYSDISTSLCFECLFRSVLVAFAGG